jgi:hypothetical protein
MLDERSEAGAVDDVQAEPRLSREHARPGQSSTPNTSAEALQHAQSLQPDGWTSIAAVSRRCEGDANDRIRVDLLGEGRSARSPEAADDE